MRNPILVAVSLVLVLSGCLVAPRRGGGLEIIPILPLIVELGDGPYYEHQGYHYFYST